MAATLNCSQVYTDVDPDADITGPGVIGAFVATNAIALIVSTAVKVLDYLPESSTEPGILAKYCSVSGDKKDYWHAVAERYLLGLADQIMITGLVVLIVGFSKADLTTYHFYVIFDLSNLASGSHFCALKHLNAYFRRYTGARFWRVFIMVVMCVGLLATNVLTTDASLLSSNGDDTLDNYLAVPARCRFLWNLESWRTNTLNGGAILECIFWVTMALYGYCATIAGFFVDPVSKRQKVKSSKALFKRFLRRVGLKVGDSTSARNTRFRRLWRYTSLPRYLSFDALWFGLGCWWLFSDLLSIKQEPISDADQWDFGQLVPVGLMILPALTALEIFYEETESFKARQEEIKGTRLALREASSQQPDTILPMANKKGSRPSSASSGLIEPGHDDISLRSTGGIGTNASIAIDAPSPAASLRPITRAPTWRGTNRITRNISSEVEQEQMQELRETPESR